jgi:hypothetical protein
MRARRLAFVFAVFASSSFLLATPRVARADASADADAALQHGVELRKEGKDEEALAEFTRANTLVSSPRARAQIGLAELALGRWVDAERDLDEALRAKDDAWIARYVPELERSLAIARPHLGWLQVDANVPGAELELNGARAGTLPLSAPARVVAGSVVVEVRAPGYVTVERPVVVAPGAHMREEVTLVPVVAQGQHPAPRATTTTAAPAAPAADADAGAGLRVAAIVTSGVALGALAVGGWFGFETFIAKSDRDGHCTPAGCDPTGLARDSDARRDATISTIGFAAGGVGAAVAAILFWRASRASVSVAPAVGANAASLSVLGQF